MSDLSVLSLVRWGIVMQCRGLLILDHPAELSMDRDKFMSPEEAKEFGLIDEVIEHRPVELVADLKVGARRS